MDVRTVTPELDGAVVAVQFPLRPGGVAVAQRRAFLDLVDGGQVDRGCWLAAFDGDTAVASLVYQLLPGRTGVMIHPVGSIACQQAVLHAADAEFRHRGLQYVHLFQDEPSIIDAPLLIEQYGFRFITVLQSRSCMLSTHRARAGAELTFTPYAQCDWLQFASVLQRTYEGTLDVPEATVPRTPAELIASSSQGQPNPPHWWFASTIQGAPAGVVLLATVGAGILELAYLGVLPEYRRMTFGRRLVEFACAQAIDLGATYLQLTVDVRNAPALRVYESLKFELSITQRLYQWSRR